MTSELDSIKSMYEGPSSKIPLSRSNGQQNMQMEKKYVCSAYIMAGCTYIEIDMGGVLFKICFYYIFFLLFVLYRIVPFESWYILPSSKLCED